MDDGVLSAAIHPKLQSPDHVFRQYLGRRAGIVKALTEDVAEFYEQCDPEKAGLCLYGLPDGTWKVNFPVEKIPSILPEPVCGINFARDGTAKKDWISLIAVHSDAWLMSMAFYHAGRLAFDREARTELFRMINSFSTTFEVVRESYKKKRSQVCNGSIENKSSFQPPRKPNSNSKPVKQALQTLEEENGAKAGEGGDDQASNECAACCEAYSDDELHFWIFCDDCTRWFHGKCVQVTPTMAKAMKKYVCPGCSYRSKATKASGANVVTSLDS
ncbi:PHD finger protein ALFIN-LIKE 4 isoform X2 [Brachypodium distachyon]|uniref:PHD finger protein ALFIN-LIKE n=1 Tax=Brachypodium distachyon TaxID=15368 RepID=I1IY44_BRADI|nr:PHD finger protein ALFIN-LIKE 4 isoform X2 [Brachypodium distachyon]KQJ82814.1 hypothetical protein BRADI_5g11130v3 [Brachypodium distachyon]|eukprot:XP_003579830.1 PHD finger protein ALFIN-LIKE 4 isoform X2 [Brachypodium distachyon]